jgi:hypothetical protein
MRVTHVELGIVALLIGYIAFFTHPPPAHIADFLSTPVGKIIALVGILFVTVYHSLLVGVFLAIAYLLSSSGVTEYLDEKEQKPKEQKQPTSKGVPPPEVKSMLSSLLKAQTGPAFKGDNRLPSAGQKKGSAPPPASKTVTPPKAASSLAKGATTEHFASF